MNYWLKRALAVLALAYVGVVTAAPFSTAPVLRVETGTHSGGIFDVATDPAALYLATAGIDQTIRLWSRESGELLRVMRPPIGEGLQGSVRAVAFSPDGKLLLAGGFFCAWHETFACLLLFDTASGRLVRRIDGQPSTTRRLAWSPDGSLVAVGLSQGGLRLLRTSDWATVGSDENYQGNVLDIDFSSRGQLAAGGEDQAVRIYSLAGGLKLTARKETSEISPRAVGIVASVRFSPDGKLLAVAQTRTSRAVSVHDAATLATLYYPSVNWGANIGTQSIGWSPDGEYLYAGTGGFNDVRGFIRRWSGAGRGFSTDWPVGSNMVTRTTVTRDGDIAFVTLDGPMGLYHSDGRLAWDRGPQAAHFHGTADALRVSQDGMRVEFPYDTSGRSTLNFDITQRRLAAGEAPGMHRAATAGGQLNFFNLWRDTRGPLQVGNVRLAITPSEVSRSLSMAPDNRSFTIGTWTQLRHFDDSGKQLWAVPMFEAFAVNHSGDGRLLVVASGDGTLRWFNAATGHFLAALYVAPDRKRWVLASASGYYDASVGAEDFLGWHINRGPSSESDFVPVSRLRSHFYRPEIVADILRTASDAKAVQLAQAELRDAATPAPTISTPAPAAPAAPAVAVSPPEPVAPPAPAVEPPKPAPVAPVAAGQRPAAASDEPEVESTVTQTVVDLTRILPPVVTIVSPAPGSSFSTGTVTVKYIVRTEADSPLLGVRARVNGLSRDTRNLTLAAVGEVREMTVNVPQEDSEILLFAENRHGISAPATLKLAYRGAPVQRAPSAKPVLYVLAIGVSDYVNPQYRLNFAAKDARDFVSVVQKQKGRLYSDVVVKTLTDRDATSRQVVEGFEWLEKSVTDKDTGMVFIAGHGLNDDKGRYYFLPANIDLDHLPETGVPFTQIRGHLSNLKGKGLLFVDTCHSGDVMGGRAGFSTDVNGVLNELSSAEYGLVVLASSTGKQFSLEDPSWGNGAFTKALVEGLNGQADLKHRGRITHKMLDFYVSDRVDELTNGQQTPVNPSPQGVPDYPIAATGI